MEEPPTLSTLRNVDSTGSCNSLQKPPSMMDPSMRISCAISLVQQLQINPTSESLYTTLKSADLANIYF